MIVFIDTSALYALLDADDTNHAAAQRTLAKLRDAVLTTHAYVVVESLALVSRRLGREAAIHFIDDLLPVIQVEPVGAALHDTAMIAFRDAGRAGVSFVDHTSFAFMRLNGVETAFAFDADFVRAGLTLIPSQA